MDGSNWRPAAPGGEDLVDRVDWRTQLQPDARQRIVYKIIETLKRHIPVAGQEGLQEIIKIAERFEEGIYSSASSQPDYLRKISIKMLTLESRSANTIQNTGSMNHASNSNRLPDTGAFHSLPSHVQNPSQAYPQMVSQNVQNNTAPGGILISTGLNTSWPSVSGINQSPMTNVTGLDGNTQNVQSIQASSVNEMGQIVHSRVFSGSHRHMENVALPQQQIQAENYQYFRQVQNQPQAHQQLASQNVQNNITHGGVQSLTGLNTSLPSVSGIIPSSMTNAFSLNSNMQNRPSISQASASLDPVAQSGRVNAGDWQEEAYQKVKQMKENHMPELTEIYQKVSAKLQQHDSMPQQPKSEQHEKLKMFKQMVERLVHVLQTPKSNINPGFKEKLVIYEKQIQSFLSCNRARKPLQQGLAQPKEPPPSPDELTLGCPICLGPLVKETTTRCGHIFCEKCINTALAKQSRCPTCRMPMAAGDLIRVFLGTNISVGEFWTVP